MREDTIKKEMKGRATRGEMIRSVRKGHQNILFIFYYYYYYYYYYYFYYFFYFYLFIYFLNLIRVAEYVNEDKPLPFVFLSYVVLLGEVDQVDNRFAGQEEVFVKQLNL